MSLRRGAALGAGLAGGAGGAALLYALQRAAVARWSADPEEIEAAGRSLPPALEHHFVKTSDGGRVHAIVGGRRGVPGRERPTYVLVHGITLGVATWAPQLRNLEGRVVAVSQRGHGQSRAGTEGYTFDRLVADLVEVLDELDVRDAVLVAHSMGGMVSQLLALTRPDDLTRHVRRLVLVGTTPGPAVASPLGPLLTAAVGRALLGAERRGRGPFPKSATIWAARLAFGARPSPVDMELLRSMLDAMSPSALAALLPHLFTFDVRGRLGALGIPVEVVVGSRDMLTPPRTARAIVDRVPGARFTLLANAGHMVMLERAEALCELVAA